MTELVNCVIEPCKIKALLEEANALSKYVYRHGDILKPDEKPIFQNFLTALKNLECTKSAESWIELQARYADLSTITFALKGVNGHTVLETRRATQGFFQISNIPRIRPVIIGFTLFFIVILIEVLKPWIAESNQSTHFLLKPTYIFLTGATWGGIGSCLFLMKRISDKIFTEAFSHDKVHGDIARIFLGAMLGVCVVLLFFTDDKDIKTFSEFNIGPAIAAFIAGLGIKPVYAAFETLSEELAARLGKYKGK